MPRKARLITHDGCSDTIVGWAAKLGITREALEQRLLHWSVADAVTTPRYHHRVTTTPRKHGALTHNGHTDTIAGWAAKIGITKSAMYQRLESGWTVAEVCGNKRICSSARRAAPLPITPVVSVTTPQLEDDLARQHLAMRRMFNSVLRQFNRDLHTLMSRSLDRGVVLDLSDLPFDRSLPVARDRV